MLYFTGYLGGKIHWAPLLAYAIMRGHPFVTEREWAMPVVSGSTSWREYVFDEFAEDGLVVVQPPGLAECCESLFATVVCEMHD